ncbi:MAG: class A beta-lactamase [Pseudomonadota bacterium]
MSYLRWALVSVVWGLPMAAFAADLPTTVERLERALGARIGVAIVNSHTGEQWMYRPHERFLMNSTVKVLVCAAVLARDDLSLSEPLQVRARDVIGHAPVTRFRIGEAMTVSELCLAAVDQSDNGATNRLFEALGGPAQVTNFLRSIGDTVTRSDRTEPALNAFVSGDPRDTTSPAAMVMTLATLLDGDALTMVDRMKLGNWMRPGAWTGALIRPSVPDGWDVADKSGSGRQNRNLIAMLTPPGGAPVFVSLFISDTHASFDRRNDTMAELGAAVIEYLTKR